MPDITMCANFHCGLRQDCYRFSAKPKPIMQSYALFEPTASDKCDHFYEIDKSQQDLVPVNQIIKARRTAKDNFSLKK